LAVLPKKRGEKGGEKKGKRNIRTFVGNADVCGAADHVPNHCPEGKKKRR